MTPSAHSDDRKPFPVMLGHACLPPINRHQSTVGWPDTCSQPYICLSAAGRKPLICGQQGGDPCVHERPSTSKDSKHFWRKCILRKCVPELLWVIASFWSRSG